MARRHVLVEVPLTSNAQILGVFGAAHPFVNYRAAGVPVALATDDPAVERIDLTHEYQLATTRYRLDYGELKTLSRASLEQRSSPEPASGDRPTTTARHGRAPPTGPANAIRAGAAGHCCGTARRR